MDTKFNTRTKYGYKFSYVLRFAIFMGYDQRTLIINTFAIDEFEYAIKFNLLLQLNKQHCQFNTQKFIYDDLMEFDEDNDLMVSNWHCASLCHDQRNQTGSKPYTSNSNNNRMNQIYKNQKDSISQQKNLNFIPKKNSSIFSLYYWSSGPQYLC
eukprot:403355907